MFKTTDIQDEKQIERYLVNRVKELGGRAIKCDSNTAAGVPDRICIMPDGEILFVECKARAGRLSKLQSLFIDWLVETNHRVAIVYSKEDIDELF